MTTQMTTQMNLVLKELTKKKTTVRKCGGIGLKCSAYYRDVRCRLNDMKYINSWNIRYAGKKFSIKSFFKNMVYGNKVYNDKRCGLYGLKSTIWKTNPHLQYDLKKFWVHFQGDWTTHNALTGGSMAEWELDTYKKSKFITYLVEKYWKKSRPAGLWEWDKAANWVQAHYNKDYCDMIWKSEVYLEEGRKQIQELEKFINSFGEGKEYDLTQLMGNDLYTKEQVKGMWNERNSWGTDNMENYLYRQVLEEQ